MRRFSAEKMEISEKELKKQLVLAFKKAGNISRYYNLKELQKLLNSVRSDKRLFSLVIIRGQIQYSTNLKSYFSLAKKSIEDSNNNCRWQALIIIGEYLDKYPGEIFKIIIKYGSSEDKDMRMAIAVILLEHLFEINFVKYFRLLKNISKSNFNLLDTLSLSTSFIKVSEEKEVNKFVNTRIKVLENLG